MSLLAMTALSCMIGIQHPRASGGFSQALVQASRVHYAEGHAFHPLKKQEWRRTFPRANRLRLMLVVSFNMSPVLLVSLNRSLCCHEEGSWSGPYWCDTAVSGSCHGDRWPQG